MPNWSWTRGICVMAVMLLPGSVASAHSIGGSLGPESRAEVKISVSVVPRFKVTPPLVSKGGMIPHIDRPSQSIRISTNAPALRFSLVSHPTAPGTILETSVAGERPAANRLVVVVPD
jgi:hypothetical protein